MAQNQFRNQVYRPKRRVKLFALGDVISTRMLMANLPYIGFIAGLMIIYIANSHYAVKTIKEINVMQEQMKKLSWESNARKSELMYNTMQSQISNRVGHTGLNELTEKPKKLEY